MKFTIAKEEFSKALEMTSGTVEKKSTKPVLSNVLLKAENNQLSVIATDMDIEVIVTLDNIPIEAEGAITVPAKKLLDIVKATPGDTHIQVSVTANRALLTYGRSRFELSTLPAEEFPDLENLIFDMSFTISESDFSKMIGKTSYAMASQDVRFYLNGMLLDLKDSTTHAVATDGHRLALTASSEVTFEDLAQEGHKIIIPRKTIQELSRLLAADAHTPITLHIHSNHIQLKKDNIQLTSKLIDSRYPDYEAAIPSSYAHKLEVDRLQLRDSISRVAILSNDKYKAILITLENGEMSLNSNNPEQETAEEKIDINYQDEKFEIGYNATYVLDALNHLEGDSVVLNLNGVDSSTLIYSPDDEATRFIVMPVKI